jgi:hypothetical protein
VLPTPTQIQVAQYPSISTSIMTNAHECWWLISSSPHSLTLLRSFYERGSICVTPCPFPDWRYFPKRRCTLLVWSLGGTPRPLPVGHPSQNCSSPSTLNLEVLSRQASEKEDAPCWYEALGQDITIHWSQDITIWKWHSTLWPLRRSQWQCWP